MRLTYTQIKNSFYRKIGTSSTEATADQQTEASENINGTIRYMRSQLPNYTTGGTRTALTEEGKQYYYLPPGLVQVDSISVTIGSNVYVLKSVESKDRWRQLNSLTINVTDIPDSYIVREKDFGIWPIPQTDGYTITVDYSYLTGDLYAEDYTTGTVTVTENSTTVTGSGTSWTSAMDGRWFHVTNTDNWYRIATVNNATSLDLETYYEEDSASTQTYTIGQTPELPPEAHELIAWRAAGMYLGGPREDTEGKSKNNMNFFYTGDFNNSARSGMDIAGGFISIKKKYSKSTNSNVIHVSKNARSDMQLREKYGVTITDV
jgi:hypothetical protein